MLGDYVTLGWYSKEVMLLLFALKIRCPSRLHLLRGKTESCNVSKGYDMDNECSTYFAFCVSSFFSYLGNKKTR